MSIHESSKLMYVESTIVEKQTLSLTQWDVTEEDRLLGQRLLIPKFLLQGTKPREEYNGPSERRTKSLQKTPYGMLEMLDNPAIIVSFKRGDGVELLIVDGHHRARWCTRPVVPCIVFSEEHATQMLNRRLEKKLTMEEHRTIMFADAQKALYSFSFSLPPEKYPKPITGSITTQNLSTYPGIRPY